MSAVSEAHDQTQHALDCAGLYATQLGKLLALPFDARGRPSALTTPQVRQMLAQSMRDAADGCEIIGVQHNDPRWCGPVALIHVASTQVWTVLDARTCDTIAALMSRLRVVIALMKDRALNAGVSMRIN